MMMQPRTAAEVKAHPGCSGQLTLKYTREKRYTTRGGGPIQAQ